MSARIRRKQPTMGEQIEELKAQIQELETEKAELYERVQVVEASVTESRPYQLLKRQYEELLEIVLLRNGSAKTAPQNPKRGRPVSITEEQRQAAIEMRQQGASLRVIARELGISLGTAANIAKSV